MVLFNVGWEGRRLEETVMNGGICSTGCSHSLDFGARWVSESDGPSLGASIVDLHVRG
jgi:hypothetical protein